MFITLTIYTDRFKRLSSLYDLIYIERDRNEPVRVLCFGSPDVQQAVTVIDIPADQIDSLFRSASTFQDNNKQQVCRILRINFEKMLTFVFCEEIKKIQEGDLKEIREDVTSMGANLQQKIAIIEMELGHTRNDITTLSARVEKHNNVIERTYRLEETDKLLDEKIKVANHRIDDLEKKA